MNKSRKDRLRPVQLTYFSKHIDGYLLGFFSTDKQAVALVEDLEGQVHEVYANAIRFMDRAEAKYELTWAELNDVLDMLDYVEEAVPTEMRGIVQQMQAICSGMTVEMGRGKEEVTLTIKA